MTADLIHSLERTVLISARRETVFRFFTDSKRFADWWGEGSTIEGKPGGSYLIRYPNGLLASGKILEMNPPERIVFTYGYESGKPFPPGQSRVTVTLQELEEGTRLTLRHEFSDPSVRDEHIQGWRYQLALFANAASRDQHSDIVQRLDAYYSLWNTISAAERLQKMEGLLKEEVRFHDKHSCTSGWDDLNAHLTAYQNFMPGMNLSRDGEPQQCQGTVISRWIAAKKDGALVAKGSNVFVLSPGGLIRQVTGFWD